MWPSKSDVSRRLLGKVIILLLCSIELIVASDSISPFTSREHDDDHDGYLLHQYYDYMSQNGRLDYKYPEVGHVAHFEDSPGGGGGRSDFFSGYHCPAEPASESFYRNAEMIYYVPQDKRKVLIKEKAGGFNSSEIGSFLKQGFDLEKPTLFLMAGYLQQTNEPWADRLLNNYNDMNEARGDEGPVFNLLLFDMSAYSQSMYGTYVSYVPHLGALLAKFVEVLVDLHNYDLSNIHFQSFSLSTHIVGMAGRQLRSKYGKPIGQITAVDPTGVCFHVDTKFARLYSLRPNDAALVVSRHYNMHEFGARRLIGGVDIIINDGNHQPYMAQEALAIPWWFKLLGVQLISHMQGIAHEATKFTGLEADCNEMAWQCPSEPSLESFMAGKCGPDTGSGRNLGVWFPINTFGNYETGFHAEEKNYKNGMIMLTTTGKKRFCSIHYQVVAVTRKDLDADALAMVSDALLNGEFSFRVRTSRYGSAVEKWLIVKPMNEMPDQDPNLSRNLFTTLIRPMKMLAPFPDELKISDKRQVLKHLEFVHINCMSHILDERRKEESATFCTDSELGVLKKCEDAQW